MKKPLTDIVVNGGERWFTAKIRLQNVNVRSCGKHALQKMDVERHVFPTADIAVKFPSSLVE